MTNQENGEWLDKEPRADGRRRTWKPFDILAVDPSRIITQEDKIQRPSGDIRLHDRISK
jgi:hypothetical protein